METEKNSYGSRELEFAIFCIENVASRLNVDARKVYAALAEQTNILNGYIIPEYDVLHTQSKDYIVEDIIDVMKERGVSCECKSDSVAEKVCSCGGDFCKKETYTTGDGTGCFLSL